MWPVTLTSAYGLCLSNWQEAHRAYRLPHKLLSYLEGCLLPSTLHITASIALPIQIQLAHT